MTITSLTGLIGYLPRKTAPLALAALVLQLLAGFSATPSAAFSSEGLVAYYPFSGGASDVSGNGYHGSENGAALSADRDGNADSAYAFDGSGATISVANAPFTFAGDFSLSFWAISPVGTGRTHAFSLGSSEQDNLEFDFNDGYGVWVFWNGGGGNGIRAGAVGAFTDGRWHQFLLQRSGTTVRLYVDGIFQGETQDSAPIGSSTVLTVGKGSSGPGWTYAWDAPSWTGKIDEVRLYNRALPLEEMGLTYPVTLIGDSYGSISGPQTVGYGEAPTYTFIPAPGCQVVDASVDGVSLGAVTGYTFPNGITGPVTIMASFSYSLANGLLGYYPFNGNAVDASGNGHHGVILGATATTDRFENPVSAYAFNGSSASIEVADSPTTFTGDFAVSFWEHASGASTDRMHALSLGDVGNTYLDFDFNDAAGVRLVWGGATAEIAVGEVGSLTDGRWHHLLLQRRGSTVQLYVDGTLRGAAENAAPLGAPVMRVGRGSRPDKGWWWKGTVDEIRIYGRALIPEEVADLSATPATSLLAYYPFDGGAEDATGNGYNASVSGAVLTSSRFGAPNSAYSFNGTNNAIELDSAPTSFPGDFTISFWEKSTAGAASGTALSMGNAGDGNIDFRFNDCGGLWVYWSGGGANGIKAGKIGAFTDGAWHHVLLRRSGKLVQLFLDGLPMGTFSYAQPLGSPVLRIGRGSQRTGWPWWQGEVDDLRIYSRAVIDEEVAALAVSPAGRTLVNLPFNGDAQDQSGNKALPVVQDALVATDRFGIPTGAYSFNGSGSSIEVANTPTLFPGDFCISFWEKGTVSTNRMHALSIGSTSSANIDFDFNDASGLWVYWNSGGANAIRTGAPGAFTDGLWHHVLLQRVGTQVQLFVDGALKGSVEYSLPIGSKARLRLGRSSSDPPWWWNGSMDDVRIYDHALTLDQIDAEVHQGPAPGAPLSDGALTVYYPFNGNARDESGNGRDGIVSGAQPIKDRFRNDRSAYEFNGTDASIEISGPTSLSGDFFISFWEKADLAADPMPAFTLGDGGSAVEVVFNAGAGVTVSWAGDGANAVSGGAIGAFTDGQWHHILLQRSAGLFQIYVDGTVLGSTEDVLTPGSSTIHLGRNAAGTRWWRGALDDLRIGRRALSNDEIVGQVYQWKRITALNLSSRAVSYFPLDGDAKNQYDSSSDGQVIGAVPAPDRFEVPGHALAFDGVGASVEIANSTAPWSADFAFSFWEKSSRDRRRMHAISLGTSDLDNLDFDFNDDAGLWVFWSGSGTNAIRAGKSGAYTDGAWHHVLLQRSGQLVQLYIDGVPAGSIEYSLPMGSASGMRLGRSSSGPAWPYDWSPCWWDGSLDDVSVYDHALTVEEIRTLAVAPSAALSAYYPLNGDAKSAGGAAPDGMVNGAVPAPDRSGMSDQALFFNGEGAVVEVANSGTAFPGDFSIAFWESAPATTNRMHAISMGEPQSGNLDFAFNDGEGIKVSWNGLNAGSISGGDLGEFTDGTWHHVRLQRRGIQVQLFVDGVLKGNAVATATIGSAETLHLGRNSAGDSWWNGTLDELRMYNRSFTSDTLTKFAPRDGAGALTFDGKMWILGGWNPNVGPTTNSEVWFSTNGSDWTLSSVAPWEGRHSAGYAVFNNRMWIIGGDSNRHHYQNEVWSSADGVTWRPESNNILPSPQGWGNRVTHYVVVFQGKIWVMGGQQIPPFTGDSAVYNDVWNSEDGVNWNRISAAADWSPRGQIIGSVVFNDKMWILGGGTYDKPDLYNNDVWSSSDGVHWDLVLEHAPWSPRVYHNTVVFNNKLWVLNGGNERHSPVNFNGIWYSPDGRNWSRLPNVPMAGKHAGSVFVYNNEMWMAAGTSNASPSMQVTNEVWKLTFGP